VILDYEFYRMFKRFFNIIFSLYYDCYVYSIWTARNDNLGSDSILENGTSHAEIILTFFLAYQFLPLKRFVIASLFLWFCILIYNGFVDLRVCSGAWFYLFHIHSNNNKYFADKNASKKCLLLWASILCFSSFTPALPQYTWVYLLACFLTLVVLLLENM